MKKKVLALLLVVALIAAAVIIAVPQASAEGTHKHCVCGDKAKGVGIHYECVDVEWTAWNETDSLPTATGYYYLTEDVEIDAAQTVAGNVKLCLNGKTVTGYTTIYKLGGSTQLDICDCSAENKGAMIANTEDGAMTGAIVQITSTCKVVNLYSGTLKGGPDLANQVYGLIYCNKPININIYAAVITGGRSVNGGNIRLHDGWLNMYGGEISNGVAAPLNEGDTAYSRSTTKGSGGNIAAIGSNSIKLNLYGGVIKGGQATACTTDAPDKEASADWSGMGGNIYAGKIKNANTTAPIVTLAGTQILDGSANGTYGGSNICMYEGTFVTTDADSVENDTTIGTKNSRTVLELDRVITGVKLLPGEQALGFTIDVKGENITEYGVRVTIDGDTRKTIALTAAEANTIWLTKLLSSTDSEYVATGAETISVEVYAKVDGVNYYSKVYATSLKAVIEKAEAKTDLTEAQSTALQALKAQLGQ